MTAIGVKTQKVNWQMERRVAKDEFSRFLQISIVATMLKKVIVDERLVIPVQKKVPMAK